MPRRSERVFFPGGNGFELAGIVDQPEGNSKGTAVFTHCFTCSKDIKLIVRISRGLADYGYSVLRYDLTGLADSRGEFSVSNFTSNQADLQAAVEFASDRLSPPTFLIGHSFGGACSLSLAQQFDCVRGIVSIAAPSDTRHLADLLQRMNPAITQAGIGTVVIGGRQYTVRKQMLDDFRQFDLPSAISRMSKPTLLFHSPDDETLGFEHALRLYGLLAQRTAANAAAASTSLICLSGADHLLANNPADLTYVTSVIAAWMDRAMADAPR